MRNLQRVHFWIEAVKQPPGTPGRLEAIDELVRLAMKADTFDLLDERGWIPESLSYREGRRDSRGPQDLEGETHEHGI